MGHVQAMDLNTERIQVLVCEGHTPECDGVSQEELPKARSPQICDSVPAHCDCTDGQYPHAWNLKEIKQKSHTSRRRKVYTQNDQPATM